MLWRHWNLSGSFGGRNVADDYWNLIGYCRSGGHAHGRAVNAGWYDVVIGPVAAARWRRRQAIPYSDQVSFHTDRGAALLDKCNQRVFIRQAGRWVEVP
jgi:hypothetical protein